ncbi:MAG: outer membrane beta-barrel protein [Prevotellaceae bacterium]|jgi:hypothetical protein|nr:outer membrane beta-barrel protein [Prevotellaceae bacterium]
MKTFFNIKQTTNQAVGNIRPAAGILTLSLAFVFFCLPAMAQKTVKTETTSYTVDGTTKDTIEITKTTTETGKEITETVSYTMDGKTKDMVKLKRTKTTEIEKSDIRLFRSKYYSGLILDWGANRVDRYNMLTGAEDAVNNQFPRLRNSKSTSFSISIVAGRKIAGGLSIYSGFGFDWLNYRFTNDVTLKEIDEVTSIVPLADLYPNFNNTEKSKIVLSYFTIPLMLRFDIHKIHIAAGVTGSLNINGYARIIYSDVRGNTHKIRNYDMQPATLRYGYAVQAGFYGIGIFANYYMTPIFARHEGPQVYPFSFGVSLSFANWKKREKIKKTTVSYEK